MAFLHFSFYLVFALGFFGLAINRKFMLSALLCLEVMMLALYTAIGLWTLQVQTMSQMIMPLILLTLSACEASVGLSLLAASSRTHGSEHINNLNLLQC